MAAGILSSPLQPWTSKITLWQKKGAELPLFVKKTKISWHLQWHVDVQSVCGGKCSFLCCSSLGRQQQKQGCKKMAQPQTDHKLGVIVKQAWNVSPLTQQGAKMSSYNSRQPVESSVTLLPRADKQTDAYWLQCLGHLFMFINEIGSYLQSFANMPKRVCSLSKLDCDCLETGCPLKCDLYCHLFSWKWSPRDSDYCTCNLLGDQLVDATTFSSIGSWMQNKK